MNTRENKEPRKQYKGFMFSAELDNVAEAVTSKKRKPFKVNLKINMEEYMTKRQHRKFMKHLKKCSDISRSAYIKWVREIMKEKGIEEDK